ncbi:energy transducer TonB [Chitinimonas viridis]|uniref:Energy transducer TonB n=1 Tax=Chitinimonas viridis TaxID=664880 RepID=A0ABT8B8N4_9NEIS|nr:energy transducer TonB [Chitinimonas viridis]MDN3578404.1 energy transducer TonB [Chitinimonas viridis]
MNLPTFSASSTTTAAHCLPHPRRARLSRCGVLAATLLALGLAGCAKPSAPPPVEAPTPVVSPAPAPVVATPSRDELLAQYVDKVRRLIRSKMVYKGKTGNPDALFEVTLQPDMRIQAVRRVSSSGNKAFDQAVQRAIQKAGSYPPLPEGLEFSLFMTHKIKYRLNDLR